jgi:hypothetical protein
MHHRTAAEPSVAMQEDERVVFSQTINRMLWGPGEQQKARNSCLGLHMISSAKAMKSVCEQEGTLSANIVIVWGVKLRREIFQYSFQVKRAARERERKRARAGWPAGHACIIARPNTPPLFCSIGIQDCFSVKGEQNIKVLGPPYQTMHAGAGLPILLRLTD